MTILPHDPGNQTLPHNLDAERAALGAVLIDPSLWPDLASIVAPGDYFRHAHSLIHAELHHLATRGLVIDAVVLRDSLAQRGRLDDVGGPAYLYGLTDGVPRSGNVAYYARIVRDHARRRALLVRLRDASEAVQGGDLTVVLGQLRADLDAVVVRERRPVVTGLDILDAPDPVALHPAWPMLSAGALCGLVAPSYTGKSYLCLRIAADFLRAGRRVAYACLEGRGGLKKRLLALCSSYALEDEHLSNLVIVDRLDLSAPESVAGAIADVGNADLWIVDTLARALGTYEENAAGDMGAALNSLARIGQETGDGAVTVTHHTNRASSSERGSGAFRAGLDVLMFLEDEGETRVLRVDKSRDGEPPAPRVFRFRAVPEFGSAVLDDAINVLPAETEAELSATTRRVLDDLRLAGASKAADVVEGLKGRIGRTTIFGALKALEKLGLVRQDRGLWTALDAPSFGSSSASSVSSGPVQ